MPHFVVQVEEERKVLISSRIVKDTSFSLEKQTLTFNDLFKNLVQPVFRFREVHVFVEKGDSKWNFVQDGLQDELSLLTTLGFTHIKFVIQPEDISQRLDNTQSTNNISGINTFTILIKNANKLALSAIKKEETQYDLLYNDIIKLLKQNTVS